MILSKDYPSRRLDSWLYFTAERACPGVSRDLIRLWLRDLKAAGRIECLGRGPGAKWQKRVIRLKEGNKGGNKSSKLISKKIVV
jgi:hypothetical protein